MIDVVGDEFTVISVPGGPRFTGTLQRAAGHAETADVVFVVEDQRAA